MFDPFLIYAFTHLNYTIYLYDVDAYFCRPIFPSSMPATQHIRFVILTGSFPRRGNMTHNTS
jgi:hypothetical protein